MPQGRMLEETRCQQPMAMVAMKMGMRSEIRLDEVVMLQYTQQVG